MATKFNRLRISKFSRLARINIAVFGLLFAGAGFYLLSNGHAAVNGAGDVTVTVSRYASNGTTYLGPATGVSVTITGDATYKCHQMSPTNVATWTSSATATTDSNGQVKFGCNSSDFVGADGHVGKLYTLTNGGLSGYSSPAGASYSTYVALNSHGLLAMALNQNVAATNHAPQMNYETLSCSAASGWAYDQDVPTSSITINVTSPGIGTIYRGPTNTNRPDVNSYFGTSGNHGFSIGIPSSLKDGATHTVTVTAEDNGGNSSLNAVTSRTLSGCTVPVNASIKTPLTANPTKVNSGGKSTLSWAVNYGKSCVISYSGSSSGQTSVNSTGSWSTPSLTKSSSFTLSCSGLNGGKGITSSTSVSVNGSTAPPPPTGVTGTTSTNGRTESRSGGVVSAGSDREKPSTPTNFMAEQLGGGEVDLTWDASTDNVAVDSYILERSTDGTNWTTLDDAITDTSYSDVTADYNTQYTYRLSAKDTAGNFSDYALVDMTTNDFTSNVVADQDSTITSEDGIVEISFPANTFSEDQYCEISKDRTGSTPKGYKLVAGAYSVSCRNKAGDITTTLDSAAKVTMHLKSFAKKYGSFKAYSIDDTSTSPIESAYNKNTGDLNFEMKDLQTFAAFGTKKSSPWFMWILFPLLLIGLILLILRIRNSSGGGDNYYDTANYVTMPPSAPVSPDAGGYQHHPSLPELVAQGPQPQVQGQPPVVPGGQQPGQYPSQPGPGPGQQLPQ